MNKPDRRCGGTANRHEGKLEVEEIQRNCRIHQRIEQSKAQTGLIILIAIAISCFTSIAHAQAGWHEEERLTNDPAGCITSPNNGKYIAVDQDGNIHIVWADDRDRNLEIYHKMKCKGIWSDDERLTYAADDSKRPILVVDGLNMVHLIWNDRRDGNKEIYHRIWKDGAWGQEERVTETIGDSFGPSAVAEWLNIHLVYMEDINGHLQIMYRSFNGLEWSDPIQLTDESSGDRMVPSIDRAPDGTLHVAWWDTREEPPGNTNGKIYYREWNGSEWLPEERISSLESDAMRPSVAVDDSGFVHVAWIDRRDTYDQIHYRMKNSSGWQEEVAITSGNSEHYHPSLDAAGSDIFLVYWDNQIEETNSEIFFKRKTAGSWSGPERLSFGDNSSTLCCIYSEQNGNLHVAWVDKRDGNEEIYYREYIDPSNGIDDTDDDGEKPEVSLQSIDIFPNPFSTSTRFRLSTPKGEKCTIDIYDISGRRVNEFPNLRLREDPLFIIWNGRDRCGRGLSPGVYFVRFRIGKKSILKKVIYIR